MKNFVKGILLPLLFPLSVSVLAQRPQIKFGDIKPDDFAPSAYAVDSSASGVVLFDVGSSAFSQIAASSKFYCHQLHMLFYIARIC